MGCLFGWRVAVALTLGLVTAAPARAADASPGTPMGGAPPPPVLRCSKTWTGGAPRYRHNVTYYVADLKPSFAGNASFKPETALTPDNYKAVLDGLRSHAGVNGVRVPIFPDKDSSGYPTLYGNVLAYARSLGLLIYANPSAVGRDPFRARGQDWTDDQYASWLADYAGKFHPDVLSPFNEADRDDADMIAIVGLFRDKLKKDDPTAQMKLMGPDGEHVRYSLDLLNKDANLARSFDKIGSHNAGSDEGDTEQEWAKLVASAGGKEVWSSENPAPWQRKNPEGAPIGIEQAMLGGVQGIVSWMAKPGLVDESGNPTLKACEIAAGLIE